MGWDLGIGFANDARLKNGHIGHEQHLFERHFQLKTARRELDALKLEHGVHLVFRLNVIHRHGALVFVKHGAGAGLCSRQMLGGLDVGANEVVLAALVRANRGREPRLNVRPFQVGADPRVAFFIDEANGVGFQCLQPLQKRHVVAAEHEVNVGPLSGNHGLARRAFRGLNVEGGIPVVHHGEVGAALQAVRRG